ncbi:MAG: hypothetical protein WB987_02945 [Candidatus Acidiferrales bacterium]
MATETWRPPPFVAPASLPALLTYNSPMPTIRTRGKLPHWEADRAIYFVTFRLADSLPQSVIRAFEFERKNILATAKQAGRPLSHSEEARLKKLFDEKIQKKLDAGLGHCSLAKPEIAKLAADTLHHSDHSRYRLYASGSSSQRV